ncbi:translation initiation factor IF-2-like isoform X2 [Passer montanus]|uniref:translation initiation factor IF-2-like isoform X2 n=1 Tax=Passer montanus TaxID=9160 RepID=UPI001960B726|nr:translation initiation factor IF-2-like isoform X2 [Passer montanus]
MAGAGRALLLRSVATPPATFSLPSFFPRRRPLRPEPGSHRSRGPTGAGGVTAAGGATRTGGATRAGVPPEPGVPQEPGVAAEPGSQQKPGVAPQPGVSREPGVPWVSAARGPRARPAGGTERRARPVPPGGVPAARGARAGGAGVSGRPPSASPSSSSAQRPKALPSAARPRCRPRCSGTEKVFWVPNRALEPARLPVILSVRSGSRCLRTERGPGGDPRLRLQDVDIRELPRAGDSAVAFTFFRSYRDGLWRFESAAHPGWFLCTSPRGHQPLALCRHRDVTSQLLDFYFQLC